MLFEVKLNYTKTTDNGQMKKVNEHYLVQAATFTEAETKMVEYANDYHLYEWSIKAMGIANYADIFTEIAGENYFDAAICIVTLDERSGREKEQKQKMLIAASDIEQAKQLLQVAMGYSLYRLTAIKESRIVDTINLELK